MAVGATAAGLLKGQGKKKKKKKSLNQTKSDGWN